MTTAQSWVRTNVVRPVTATPWTISVIGAVIFLAGWEVTARLFFTNLTLPAPTEMYVAYEEFSGIVLSNFWPTAETSMVGFTGAVVLGFLFAFVLSVSDKLEHGFLPLLVAGNSVPRVALAPVIIFYIGGFEAKYVISAWVAFFPMFLNAFEGLENIDEEYVHVMRSWGGTTLQQYRYIRLPNSLPFLFDGMKLAVTLSIVGAVVGEFVSANAGLGHLALFTLQTLQIPLTFAVVSIMAIFATVLFLTLFVLQDRLVHWQETSLFE